MPVHAAQLAEALVNGYAFTGVNTNCQKCMCSVQQVVEKGEKNNFWKAMLARNYNCDTEDINYSNYEVTLAEHKNALDNWHMYYIDE